MECSLLLFSPTGGTKKAALILCRALGAKTEIYDISRPDFAFAGARGDGIAIIAMPSFAGRAPALAAERLKRANGGGMPCVLLCVYGNRAFEDTLVEMDDIARQCDFNVIAAVAAIAEHSIVRQFAAGRPDAVDEKNLAEIGRQIGRKLAEETVGHDFAIPGNRPYKQTAGAALVPQATAECIACGLCAANCPAEAIPVADPAQTDRELCIACMRCVEICPVHARQTDEKIREMIAARIGPVCSIRKECEYWL